MLKLLPILLLLASCGETVDTKDYVFIKTRVNTMFTTVDDEILEYYHRFESTYNVKIDNIPANFVKLEEPILGTCNIYNGGAREILVDVRSWDQMSDLSRELLVFHELGHCYLERGHTDETVTSPDGDIPKSIMSTWILSDTLYEKYKEYYRDELSVRAVN